MSTHDGHAGWLRDCAHPDCVAKRARYMKQWTYERSHGVKRLVDAAPARRHVDTLIGAGWTLRSIAGAADVAPASVSRIKNADVRQVNRRIAAAILAVDLRQVPSRPSKQTTEPFVPRIGSTRRIQALIAIGWTHKIMQERSGVRTAVILSQQGRLVTRTTHDAVAAMYRDLSQRPGPSERSRSWAQRLGYHSPAAWDDIDLDPAPEIHEDLAHDRDVDEAVVLRVLAGDPVPTRAAERREIVARWHTTGRPLAELERFGWKPERYKTREDAA